MSEAKEAIINYEKVSTSVDWESSIDVKYVSNSFLVVINFSVDFHLKS
jgi:hypothetical protein